MSKPSKTMAATYFGEIIDLESRAVWYSDEEDEDDEENLLDHDSGMQFIEPPPSHETVRSKLFLTFERFLPNPVINVRDCIVSLATTAQFKNSRITDPSLTLLGQYKNLAKVFLSLVPNQPLVDGESGGTLWLMLDQAASSIVGMEVSYLVEALRDQLFAELGLNPSSPVIILAKQFSISEHLEYLSNHSDPKLALPFSGRPTLPPSLIRNSFESALFEQLTLTHKLAYVACLPDPRNYCFDKALCWPTISSQIIEQRLNEDGLDKTLIFT